MESNFDKKNPHNDKSKNQSEAIKRFNDFKNLSFRDKVKYTFFYMLPPILIAVFIAYGQMLIKPQKADKKYTKTQNNAANNAANVKEDSLPNSDIGTLALHPPSSYIDFIDLAKHFKSLRDRINSSVSGVIDYRNSKSPNYDFIYIIGILGYKSSSKSKKELHRFSLTVLYKLQTRMRIYKFRGNLGLLTVAGLEKMVYAKLKHSINLNKEQLTKLKYSNNTAESLLSA